MGFKQTYYFNRVMDHSTSSSLTQKCSMCKLTILSVACCVFGVTLALTVLMFTDKLIPHQQPNATFVSTVHFNPPQPEVYPKLAAAVVATQRITLTHADFLNEAKILNFSTVCFDYDDTLAFTTPIFEYAKRFEVSLWSIVNNPKLGRRMTDFKNSTMDLLVDLVQRNISIVVITARCAETEGALKLAIRSLKQQIQENYAKRVNAKETLTQMDLILSDRKKRDIEDQTTETTTILNHTTTGPSTTVLPSSTTVSPATSVSEPSTTVLPSSTTVSPSTSVSEPSMTVLPPTTLTDLSEETSSEEEVTTTGHHNIIQDRIESLLRQLNSLEVIFSCPSLKSCLTKREAIEAYRCDAMFGDSDQDIRACLVAQYPCSPVRVMRSIKSSYRTGFHPHYLFKEPILLNSMN